MVQLNDGGISTSIKGYKIHSLEGVSLKKDIPVNLVDGLDGSYVCSTDLSVPIYSYGNSIEEVKEHMVEQLTMLHNDFVHGGIESFSEKWYVYLDYFDIE